MPLTDEQPAERTDLPDATSARPAPASAAPPVSDPARPRRSSPGLGLEDIVAVDVDDVDDAAGAPATAVAPPAESSAVSDAGLLTPEAEDPAEAAEAPAPMATAVVTVAVPADGPPATITVEVAATVGTPAVEPAAEPPADPAAEPEPSQPPADEPASPAASPTPPLDSSPAATPATPISASPSLLATSPLSDATSVYGELDSAAPAAEDALFLPQPDVVADARALVADARAAVAETGDGPSAAAKRKHGAEEPDAAPGAAQSSKRARFLVGGAATVALTLGLRYVPRLLVRL
ncbi:uncharacterized protein V1510DRAFT_118245 [Dipodascopsis tothii]|uniref:uncharacterized protein n=1 Tax=Dipodascopsis tothii TaxID=44089 RepID=UPI0034CF33A2